MLFHITFTALYGQMVVLFVLAITCARIFFVRNTRNDSIVLLSPFAFLILLAQAAAWGIGTGEVILFYLSLIVFAVNYRGFLRFSSNLYVDSYNVIFMILSTIVLIVIILTGIFFFQNRPVVMDEAKIPVTKNVRYFSGSADGGFAPAEKLFEMRNLTVTVYTPDFTRGNKENDTVILFVPDKRAHVYNYEPYLMLLAKAGYKIYAGEFGFSTVPLNIKVKVNIGFLRQRLFFINTRSNPEKYFEKNPQFYDIYAREYEILSGIAARLEPSTKKFVVVADGIPEKSFSKILKPARLLSCIGLSSVKEYKTNGYGFIEQTNPLLSFLKFNLKRDKHNHMPSLMVMETKKKINRMYREQEENDAQ
ncbi:hypothetical protein [Treponema sp.]|uniref:hypothetical protein n=1 Tax=Treponema sp. TaxID=166 RepID=UPI00388D265A